MIKKKTKTKTGVRGFDWSGGDVQQFFNFDVALSCKVCRYVLKCETYFLIAPCNALQGFVAQYAADQTRNTRANPFKQ